MNKWLGLAICACAPFAHATQPVLEGLMPLEATGNGATVIMSGVLTPRTFKLQGVRIIASQLAGRSADPDQFRALLLDAAGDKLGVVTMWSPLLAFEWDMEGIEETANEYPERTVDILVPATLALESVVLSWSEGRQVARVEVGDYVRKFCADARDNPACGRSRPPR